MPTDRQVLEMNARAISILHLTHEGPCEPRHQALMAAELGDVAAWYREAGVAGASLIKKVIEPIAAELNDRYGPEHGPRLHARLVAAFTGGTEPSRVTGHGEQAETKVILPTRIS